MADREVFVVAARRTPVGKRGQSLAAAHPAELLGSLLAATLDQVSLDPTAVDQVLVGCVTQVGDQAYNIGRVSWLTAGLPEQVPATTLDAQCGSSHQAINLATSAIAAGHARVVIAAGVELMSRHPLGSNVEGGDGEPMGNAYRQRFEVTDQGEAAERIADRWAVSRSECDAIALRSQVLAREAAEGGRFSAEIHPVHLAPDDRQGERVRLDHDETWRPTTAGGLAALPPVFRPDGCMTAGNSSQIADGAACLVLASPSAVDELGLRSLGRVAHQSFVGVDPVLKLTGPILATDKLLATAGLGVEDVHRFEVNEAFASVLAAWYREIQAPEERVNVNGGAIALGHPVGATGARLSTTLLHELQRRGGGRGIVTMCCGGGLGTATLFEVDTPQ